MTYYNLVFRAGHERFAAGAGRVAASAGSSCPTCRWRSWARGGRPRDAAGIETVLLAGADHPRRPAGRGVRAAQGLRLRREPHGGDRRAGDAGGASRPCWPGGSRRPPICPVIMGFGIVDARAGGRGRRSTPTASSWRPPSCVACWRVPRSRMCTVSSQECGRHSTAGKSSPPNVCVEGQVPDPAREVGRRSR